MKRWFFFLLLCLPVPTCGAIEAPLHREMPGAVAAVCTERPIRYKSTFLKRFITKALVKNLQKAKNRSYGNDDKGLCITGFAIGVTALLSSPVFVGLIFTFGFGYLALFVALCSAGLLLSILGLIRAKEWRQNRAVKILAIMGIVLNGIFVAGGTLLLLFWAMGVIL